MKHALIAAFAALIFAAVPAHAQMKNDPEVKKLNVKGVPTGIVYVEGKEIGRITNDAWDAPEIQLNKLVAGQAAAKGK